MMCKKPSRPAPYHQNAASLCNKVNELAIDMGEGVPKKHSFLMNSTAYDDRLPPIVYLIGLPLGMCARTKYVDGEAPFRAETRITTGDTLSMEAQRRDTECFRPETSSQELR